MDSSLTQNTFNYLARHAFAVTSGRVGLLMLILLVALLVEKEVMRAIVRSLPATPRRVFDVAAIPLLLSFAVVVFERFRVLGF